MSILVKIELEDTCGIISKIFSKKYRLDIYNTYLFLRVIPFYTLTLTYYNLYYAFLKS